MSRPRKDLQKAQGAVAVLSPQHKPLRDKVASLTEGQELIRVERANIKTDLIEMTVLAQLLKDDAGKLFSVMSMEV